MKAKYDNLTSCLDKLRVEKNAKGLIKYLFGEESGFFKTIKDKLGLTEE